MDDDTHLIQQARQGDGRAVRTLYERHSGRVFAVVKRLAGHDEALAEDWAQEAWVRAIRALPTFRGDSRFTTWLHRIAVNSALHGRRTRLRKAGREAPMIDEGAVAVRPAAETSVLRMKLERAMERLPDGMRRVLVLHDVEGYTHEEIAQLLGVTPGTCKSQLFKARARMRKLLSPHPDEAADEPAEEEMAACGT